MNLNKIKFFFYLITNSIVAINDPITALWNTGTEVVENYGRGQEARQESAEKTVTIRGMVTVMDNQAIALQKALENQKAAQKATDVFMKDFSKRIGKGLEKNAQAIDNSTAAQVEINKTLQNINAGAQVIGAIGGAVYIAKSAKEAYDFVNPNPKKCAQDEVETEVAITTDRVLKTRNRLHRCLALHRKESRSANGLPYSCDETYHEFAAAAGYENAEHIAQAFRHANPIHNSQS